METSVSPIGAHEHPRRAGQEWLRPGATRTKGHPIVGGPGLRSTSPARRTDGWVGRLRADSKGRTGENWLRGRGPDTGRLPPWFMGRGPDGGTIGGAAIHAEGQSGEVLGSGDVFDDDSGAVEAVVPVGEPPRIFTGAGGAVAGSGEPGGVSSRAVEVV